MSLSSKQKLERLYKKSLGLTDTNNSYSGETFDNYNESIYSRESIYKAQIYSDSDLIPITAPTGMTNGSIVGVIQYFEDLVLLPIVGSTTAFYHSALTYTIPFNYDPNGSYKHIVKDTNGNVINSDYLVDCDASVLNFYGELPKYIPVSISFYKYVGTFGQVGGGSSVTGGTSYTFTNGLLKSGKNVNVGGILDNSNANLTISNISIEYTSDLSSSYNDRSLVDKGFILSNSSVTINSNSNIGEILYVSNDTSGSINTTIFSGNSNLIYDGSGLTINSNLNISNTTINTGNANNVGLEVVGNSTKEYDIKNRILAFGATNLNNIISSTDGFNWEYSTNSNSIFTTQSNSSTYGNGVYVAGGQGTNTLAYSNDGIV